MTETAHHNEQASEFRALHIPGTPLRLANVWDAASARIVEEAGAAALATSSAAVANVLGYADGEALPPDELVAALRRIAAVIRVPLSVDAEAGYGATPNAAADSVERLVDAGAIGINLEDGSEPATLLADKITAIRARAVARGRDVFINARTDVFLRGLVADEAAVDETLQRLRLYREAGADGAFVPGLVDVPRIRAIVAANVMPLNVLVLPGIADVADLAAAGVARISLGSGIFRTGMTVVQRVAEEFLRDGTYRALDAEGSLTHRQVNALFTDRQSG
ncbi:MAG: isocitrate lyase/phosphoenolpyruvate mutase family protein [bacterium]